jgi:xylitol oxidase
MSQTNWAGNLTYAAASTVAPGTVAEAQEAVRSARKLRVVGSRHCFNDIADTPATQLSLHKLNRVVSIDKARRRVAVEGGIRYGELGPILHEEGFALHNLASLPHISIAGAVATATHGSGVTLGGLATAIVAMEFIDAAGNLVALSREQNPDTFPGAVVSLGALGVVTGLTLDVVPDFAVGQDVYRDLPVASVERHFDEIMSAGYSVSLFTAWQSDTIEQVWVKSRVADGEAFGAPPSLFGARPAATKMHPIAHLDAVNCTEQMGEAGPSYDRLPHFRMGFTPASGEELQVEYFVPREHAVAAAKTIRAYGPKFGKLLMISEVRTIAGDDLWMSPFSRGPSVAFHFSFEKQWPAVRRLLVGLEAALAPFSPLPHWGKLFALPAATIRAGYPKLAAFRDLLATHDPGGKFRNAYVDRYVFGGG